MGATADVYNNIARTRRLSLLQLTNSQGLAFANLAIILSTEVQGFELHLNQLLLQDLSMNKPASLVVETAPSSYAAYIGIDRADRKHDVCLYEINLKLLESINFCLKFAYSR
jgi:hypothetical protein